MRITLFLVFLSGFSLFAQDFAPPPAVRLPDQAPMLKRTDFNSHCGCGRDPHYLGGRNALSAFISENISFPSDMNWGGVQRVRAYVQFIVEKDGSLTNLHVIHSSFSDTDVYILDVFRKMTNWVADEYGCSLRPTYIRVPVTIIIR